jgi:hypothetical protein
LLPFKTPKQVLQNGHADEVRSSKKPYNTIVSESLFRKAESRWTHLDINIWFKLTLRAFSNLIIEVRAWLGVWMLPQPPRLVFISGNADRAVDAFRVEAVDYLLKPLDRGQIAQTVNRLLAYLRPYEVGSLPSYSHGVNPVVVGTRCGSPVQLTSCFQSRMSIARRCRYSRVEKLRSYCIRTRCRKRSNPILQYSINPASLFLHERAIKNRP